MTNEIMLTESKTMRNEHAYKVEVLNLIKPVVTLGDKEELTLQMVADWYEVDYETVKKLVKRGGKEFKDNDELRLLKGKALTELKESIWSGQDIPSNDTLNKTTILQLLNRNGLLRVGMMLTKSDIATTVRNYLVGVENISTKKQQDWAIQRAIGKHQRKKVTDAIKECVDDVQPWHYAKYTNLIYEIVFGRTAAQLKEEHGVDNNDLLRDCFEGDELKLITAMEDYLTTFITFDYSYSEIESLLKRQLSKIAC